MSPRSRRDVVASHRHSFASLAGLSGVAARVASSSRSRAKRRRWLARALLVSPAVAIVASDALRRGPWLLHMQGENVTSYVASLLMTCALWASLVCMATRRRGPACSSRPLEQLDGAVVEKFEVEAGAFQEV